MLFPPKLRVVQVVHDMDWFLSGNPDVGNKKREWAASSIGVQKLHSSKWLCKLNNHLLSVFPYPKALNFICNVERDHIH